MVLFYPVIYTLLYRESIKKHKAEEVAEIVGAFAQLVFWWVNVISIVSFLVIC